jgi:hypothetical protein
MAGVLILLWRRIRRASPFLRRGIVVHPALRVGIHVPRGDQQKQTRDDDREEQALHLLSIGTVVDRSGKAGGCHPGLQGGMTQDDRGCKSWMTPLTFFLEPPLTPKGERAGPLLSTGG